MPPLDAPEGFFSLKHIKGGSVQETHALREKQSQAVARETAKLYSDTEPDKPQTSSSSTADRA
jgi:hypothetical protein